MIEAFPLYWPEAWRRNKTRDYSRFKTGFGAARQFLIWEIQRMGGKNPIISSNVPLRNDGLPRANMPEPSDPGVAVYFKHKGKDMVFACDQYIYTRDNIYAIGKTIEALRGIQRWGASDMMERAFRGFAALPEKSSQGWRSILGFTEEESVTATQAKSKWRELAKQYHPDNPVTGNLETFERAKLAYENAMKDLQTSGEAA